MTEPLPRRTPLVRQLEDQPEPRIPWDAFAVPDDVTEAYGQPSPALMARAKHGWRRLGAVHARIDLADDQHDRAGMDGTE
ncbi:hypothetical protein ABT224_00910 [Streptomyces sp. NPDC001584]|uniref:hypothetical protein n=1 Tax=Streptomyces sp. NPDC001584 TaxID=3154521 RepID=UPI00332C816D